MKRALKAAFNTLGYSVARVDKVSKETTKRARKYETIYSRYQSYTMLARGIYTDNLMLSEHALKVPGDIVECGVWRGGMIAGISEILGPERTYWLFDSFEGLPPAQELDGAAARTWQQDTQSPNYFDNCSAEESFAHEAMAVSGATEYHLVKGWFSETVPAAAVSGIALLRLDGDWYDSTMTCLQALYPKVSDQGLIIIDDYYFWEGCTKAVHDYLSSTKSSDRIRQSRNGVAYIRRNR
jgi:O-methyltransferase